MSELIVGVIFSLIFILIAVVIACTIVFKPGKMEKIVAEPMELNHDKIVNDMVDMIRCKTVSNRDESKVEREEGRSKPAFDGMNYD